MDKFRNLSNKVSEGKNENAMSPDGKQIAFTVNPKSENFAWRGQGDPITTATGEYYLVLPLLNDAGPLPLDFVLRYASALDKNLATVNDPFATETPRHDHGHARRVPHSRTRVLDRTR